MSRILKVFSVLLTALLMTGLVCFTSVELAAKDKKDKKTEEKKDAKKDDKKDDKKEEKKEPFKADPAQQEFRPDEKEKSVWVFAVAFGGDGKTVAAAYRNHSVKIWDLAAKKDVQTLKGPETKGLGDFKSLVYADNQVYVGTGVLTKVKVAPKDDKEKAKEE